MSILTAIFLGIIEGVTEFLPVSSTGHLTIAELLLGYSINDPAITAFTAIIQSGAILATVFYFWKDIIRIITGWIAGIHNSQQRKSTEYRLGWAIIVGSMPIAIVGILFKDQIETTLRSLWFVAFALIGWSIVMWLADRHASQGRHENSATWKDTLIIGLGQSLALIPGVSRSGATISFGLLRGLDRVFVTKLSFYLAIPALVAAGILQTISEFGNIAAGVGWLPTIIASMVSFVVAYLSIAWLLQFVAKHTFTVFVVYRIIVGVVLVILLASGTISAV